MTELRVVTVGPRTKKEVATILGIPIKEVKDTFYIAVSGRTHLKSWGGFRYKLGEEFVSPEQHSGTETHPAKRIYIVYGHPFVAYRYCSTSFSRLFKLPEGTVGTITPTGDNDGTFSTDKIILLPANELEKDDTEFAQTLLGQMAKRSLVEDIAWEAVKRISDQTILEDIAKDGDYCYDSNDRIIRDHTRMAVIRKLTNQEVLTDIAEKDIRLDIRKSAIEMIADTTTLERIAMNAEHAEESILAIEWISDQSSLGRIAKDTDNWHIRGFTITRLTDPTLIASFIDIGESRLVEEAAKQRIEELREIK
jgi:hypothetical protein